jgi:predicted MFS family arabinose efflux permease
MSALSERIRGKIRSKRGSFTAAAAGFTAFVNVYALQSLLPSLADAYHTDSTSISLAVSATTLAVALASPFAGWLVGRLTRGALTKISVGGLVFCGLQVAMAESIETLILWRFIQGLFLPILIAGVLAFMAEDFSSEKLSRATSHYVTWTIVGGFAGRWIAGVTASHWGWRQALFVLALANACAGAVLIASLAGPACRIPSRKAPRLSDFVKSLGETDLQSAYLVGFSTLFTMVGAFTYVTFHLSQAPFQLSSEGLGKVFCVYLLGIAITPVVGRLLHRWGVAGTIGMTGRLAVAGLMLTLIPHLYCVVTGLSMICVAGFGTQAAVSSYIAHLGQDRKTVGAGLYLSAYYLGGSFGAFIPGLAWERYGWSGCVLLLVAVQYGMLRIGRKVASP